MINHCLFQAASNETIKNHIYLLSRLCHFFHIPVNCVIDRTVAFHYNGWKKRSHVGENDYRVKKDHCCINVRKEKHSAKQSVERFCFSTNDSRFPTAFLRPIHSPNVARGRSVSFSPRTEISFPEDEDGSEIAPAMETKAI